MNKWIKRLYIGLFIIIVLVLIVINVGMPMMSFSDEKAYAFFLENEFDGSIETINVNGRAVKIVASKPRLTDSILIVFVHGAPGSWDAFKNYLVDQDLREHARVIAYDRPGYGGSGREAMPDIKDQADVLSEIIKVHGLDKNILVGHSYGGPIVGNVALNKGRKNDVAIMIAPLIDPESEPLRWYSYFSYWKLTSWLLPKDLVVAGSEKFAHASELELMREDWKRAPCKIIHIHGLKDGLAPGKENINFSKSNIPKDKLEIVVYPDKGHLLIWNDYNRMKNIILDNL
ncbi:MAG: alpha/beta hydrolase [Bacteroidota bacterium]